MGRMGGLDKDREERLASALRENLRKRKAQARAAKTKVDKRGTNEHSGE